MRTGLSQERRLLQRGSGSTLVSTYLGMAPQVEMLMESHPTLRLKMDESQWFFHRFSHQKVPESFRLQERPKPKHVSCLSNTSGI